MASPIGPTAPSISLPTEKPKKPFYRRIWFILLVIIVVVAAAVGGFFAYKALKPVPKVDPEGDYAVTYSIGGAANAALVSYTTGDNESQTATGVASGWTQDVQVKGKVGALIAVTNGIGDTGDVSCTITANGQTLATKTASGEYAQVICQVSGADIFKTTQPATK